MTNFHNIYLSMIGECATGFGGEECDLTNDALVELLTRLMDAERDAERYRWLRNCNTIETEKLVENGHIVGFGVLDAMIDEAMKCKPKPNYATSSKS